MISKSENYKGAWIYKALPIEKAYSSYKRSFKSFFVSLYCADLFRIKYNFYVDLWIENHYGLSANFHKYADSDFGYFSVF